MAVPSENEEPQVAPGAGEDSHRQNTPPGCGSDGENERTTREQLKKTSIAGLSQQARDSADVAAGEETVSDDLAPVAVQNGNPRGRPSKKRSFEDIKDEQASPANGSTDTKRGGAHKRMRSREITHDGEVPLGYGNATNAGSPLHEESDGDAQSFPGGSGVLIDSDIPSDTNAQTAPTVEEKTLDKEDTTNEPSTGVGAETRLSSTSVQEPKSDAASQPSAATAVKASLNPGSGFANTSTASPFGAVKSPPPTDSDAKAASSTSPSAFASSGLAAFASQDKSPFGAAGSTISTGGFGGGSSGFGGGGSTFGKPTSGFGSGGGFGAGGPPSSFGSNTSPFGGRIGLGGPASGGFGGDKGFGGGSVPKPFGGAPARFGKSQGVKSDEEDDAESDNEHDQHVDQSEEEKPDSRFHQQEVETGEEGEDTVFSARAKLYHFEKEWKERGTGVIKVNVRQEPVSRIDDTEDATADIEAGDDGNFELKARVIMRSDGVHRVILNSPVFKDMKVGTQDGDEPNGKTMFLTGMDEGKPRLFQIKMGKEDTLRELYYRISEFKDIL